jgi:hypothetical protein
MSSHFIPLSRSSITRASSSGNHLLCFKFLFTGVCGGMLRFPKRGLGCCRRNLPSSSGTGDWSKPVVSSAKSPSKSSSSCCYSGVTSVSAGPGRRGGGAVVKEGTGIPQWANVPTCRQPRYFGLATPWGEGGGSGAAPPLIWQPLPPPSSRPVASSARRAPSARIFPVNVRAGVCVRPPRG